jgi:hypothetical protein
MAKIKVEAQTTGAGIYTVKSGTSATSYTSTLPDATGTLINTAPSTSGNVLTSDGTDWTSAAAAAGGKVLQTAKIVEDNTAQTIATTTYTDTGLSVSITPNATTSKILCMWTMQGVLNAAESYGVRLMKDSTAIYTSSGLDDNYTSNGLDEKIRSSYYHLDSPTTTSAVTYKIQVASYDSQSIVINGSDNQTQLVVIEMGA